MPTNNTTDYILMKNTNGELVKPVTDLAAINMATVNGIVVQGNTIGIMSDYINSCYHAEMVERATAGQAVQPSTTPST